MATAVRPDDDRKLRLHDRGADTGHAAGLHADGRVVRVVPDAVRHHVQPAAGDGWRAARPAGHREVDGHHRDDRHHHADGPGDKNAILLVDYTNTLMSRGQEPARGASGGRSDPTAADPDDDLRHGRRHAADRAGAQPGLRDSLSDGDRGDRWTDPLDALDS